MIAARRNLLRAQDSHQRDHVTFVELFFDLVFVFAVTQLSHGLLHHLTLAGALQTGLLLLAVWWAWIDTSWTTNWLDPQRMPVRLLLFALMLTGLFLSSSIPEAFVERGLSFAAAYATMQIGRSLFMMWSLARHSPANYRNFQRITCWHACVGAIWIAGGLSEGETRVLLWMLAIAIETLGPTFGFYVPGLGRSTTGDWDISGAHMAERCGLFVIIALGESILVTGATFAELEWNPTLLSAFVAALVGSIAMWWIYFNIGAERARSEIAGSGDPGRLGRLAYTYFHIPIIAGIIVAAVGDELALSHPQGHADIKMTATVLGGPALYLIGNTLFKRTVAAHVPLSHLIGLGLLAAAAPFAAWLQPLMLGAATSAILIVVCIWETISLRSFRAAPT